MPLSRAFRGYSKQTGWFCHVDNSSIRCPTSEGKKNVDECFQDRFNWRLIAINLRGKLELTSLPWRSTMANDEQELHNLGMIFHGYSPPLFWNIINRATTESHCLRIFRISPKFDRAKRNFQLIIYRGWKISLIPSFFITLQNKNP